MVLELSREGYLCKDNLIILSSTNTLERKIAILLLYGDDIIIKGDNIEEFDALKGYWGLEFELSSKKYFYKKHFYKKQILAILRALTYLFGMEVARNKTRISLSQRKYVLDLLQDTGMSLQTSSDSNGTK